MKRYIILLMATWVLGSRSQNVKGFYVNGFNSILGNTVKEDSLLLFAKNNGFNYLTLYEVHLIHNSSPLTNTSTAQTFASFINKAKTQYSIAEIGVAAENYNFFLNVIHPYNIQHPLATQKVDVYNFEFEFWIAPSVTVGSYYCNTYLQPGGYACDTAGAFQFYKKSLRRIDSLANVQGHRSEAYFGWFNAGQGKQIVQTGVDRVLLSVYIPSANYSQNYQYNYIKPRLQYLATASLSIKVLPLYSAEPSFMQTWVTNNPFFTPYTDFNNSLLAESGTWKTSILTEGIQWFAYSYLPKKNMSTALMETQIEKKFSIMPNPTSSEVNIFTHEVGEGIICDATGRTVMLLQLNAGINNISTAHLSKGLYHIRAKVDGILKTQKLLIE